LGRRREAQWRAQFVAQSAVGNITGSGSAVFGEANHGKVLESRLGGPSLRSYPTSTTFATVHLSFETLTKKVGQEIIFQEISCGLKKKIYPQQVSDTTTTQRATRHNFIQN